MKEYPMSQSKNDSNHTNSPDVSFVMPCYNEEAILGYTIPKLIEAFEEKGYKLELIAVDNGSQDRTGEIIRKFAAENRGVVYHRVEKNQGYGYGILSGIPLAKAPWVGMIPADGQVDAEDVVRLYEAVAASDGYVLGKVRRRFRMDGFRRKVVSVAYNIFIRLLWPKLGSIDVNGSPKILPRKILLAMELESKGWLLDPEIMIKAYYMGLRVMELNVFARMRSGGTSHVRPSTMWEFFKHLLEFRFSKRMNRWRNKSFDRGSLFEETSTS